MGGGKDLLAFAQRHYRRNRTIVSRDIRPILEDAAKLCGTKLKLHRFPSGRDFGTWIIPPRWDVREAWLKGPNGELIASYDDHPLFLAPYSTPFHGKLSLENLKKHVQSHATQKDAYFYEHRLAYDFRRRLKEWIITLPQNVVDRLKPGQYEVKIDLEIEPGEMLVGELALPGTSNRDIVLLCNYCHPGQVNDSFSGVLAMLEVFRRLKRLPKRRYNYRLFLMPETIGSCALLAKNPTMIKRAAAAIFSEFVGWGERWEISVSDRPGTLAWLLAKEAAAHDENLKVVDLFAGWGNDEYVFDYAGVSAMAVQKFDSPEYHSSNDAPERLQSSEILRAADIIYRMCEVAEADRVLARRHPVPVYLTRYDLYLDAVHERDAFKKRRSVLYGIDGKQSLLEIAAKAGLDFDFVRRFADQLLKHKLVRPAAAGQRR
ncbi:MAG: DUF4910 domain-containing protein [Verrucomicrobiae bacterium]|nr:DUF4910 domain-containing protein [Verrucomicrobiae bacterium]